MINLFGKIRKKLFADRKFSSYLIYAIGEIVLVVIGILIALQINNYNEGQKNRREERSLLLELKNDLLETKTDLISDIEKAQRIMRTTNAIYKKVVDGEVSAAKPYKIATSYILETSMLFPKLSAYEAIQSVGITIISNTVLRKKITDFYQLHLSRVDAAESYLQNIDNNLLRPYFISHSGSGSDCDECDDLFSLYESENANDKNLYLLSEANEQMVHILKEKFNVFKTLNRRYLELSDYIDEIIAMIDREYLPE